jgi:hypothetical protein
MGCPLLGPKQTCAGNPGISPFDPSPTFDFSKILPE